MVGARVFASERAMEGDGVTIHRAFPAGEVEDLDPFLLLDEMGRWRSTRRGGFRTILTGASRR